MRSTTTARRSQDEEATLAKDGDGAPKTYHLRPRSADRHFSVTTVGSRGASAHVADRRQASAPKSSESPASTFTASTRVPQATSSSFSATPRGTSSTIEPIVEIPPAPTPKVSIAVFDASYARGSPRDVERRVLHALRVHGFDNKVVVVSCTTRPGIAQVIYDCGENPFSYEEDGYVLRLPDGDFVSLIQEQDPAKARQRIALRPHFFSFSQLPHRLSCDDIVRIMREQGHRIKSVHLHHVDAERTVTNGNGYAFGQLRDPLPPDETVSFSVRVPNGDERFRVTVRHAKRTRASTETK